MDDLQVITILTDPDFERGAEILRQKDIGWIILDGSMSKDLERAYDIRYLPTFFLIDRDAKLLASPAPMPSENLLKLFKGYLQHDLIEDLRK